MGFVEQSCLGSVWSHFDSGVFATWFDYVPWGPHIFTKFSSSLPILTCHLMVVTPTFWIFLHSGPRFEFCFTSLSSLLDQINWLISPTNNVYLVSFFGSDPHLYIFIMSSELISTDHMLFEFYCGKM